MIFYKLTITNGENRYRTTDINDNSINHTGSAHPNNQ